MLLTYSTLVSNNVGTQLGTQSSWYTFWTNILSKQSILPLKRRANCFWRCAVRKMLIYNFPCCRRNSYPSAESKSCGESFSSFVGDNPTYSINLQDSPWRFVPHNATMETCCELVCSPSFINTMYYVFTTVPTVNAFRIMSLCTCLGNDYFVIFLMRCLLFISQMD